MANVLGGRRSREDYMLPLPRGEGVDGAPTARTLETQSQCRRFPRSANDGWDGHLPSQEPRVPYGQPGRSAGPYQELISGGAARLL